MSGTPPVYEVLGVPPASYSKIRILATATNGAQLNQRVVLNYYDTFTGGSGDTQTVLQSFSDWGAPQHFPGEAIVKTMAYRYTAGGLTKEPGSWNLYGYTFSLDKTRVVSSITMPNAHVTALAITLLP